MREREDMAMKLSEGAMEPERGSGQRLERVGSGTLWFEEVR